MKKNKRFKIKIIICAICLVVIAGSITLAFLFSNGSLKTVKPAQSQSGKYLFAYFTGDEEKDEQIRFAASEDGYNYTPINNGEPVVAQTLGTLGARDPFIARGNDGFFYLIASDMKMENGEDSNHSFITWRSTDLVTWSEETVFELRNFSGFESCNRAWAPKAIWDKDANKFMVYFVASTLSSGMESPQLYCCHTSNFKKFSAPKPLFSLEDGSISEANIIFSSAENKYYLFFESRAENKLFYTSANSLTGPFKEEPIPVIGKKGINSLAVFNISGTPSFVFAIENDKRDKTYAVQTDDFENYSFLKSSSYLFPTAAYGGCVISLSDEEFSKLIAAYGFEVESTNRLITPFSTTEETSGQ